MVRVGGGTWRLRRQRRLWMWRMAMMAAVVAAGIGAALRLIHMHHLDHSRGSLSRAALWVAPADARCRPLPLPLPQTDVDAQSQAEQADNRNRDFHLVLPFLSDQRTTVVMLAPMTEKQPPSH